MFPTLRGIVQLFILNIFVRDLIVVVLFVRVIKIDVFAVAPFTLSTSFTQLFPFSLFANEKVSPYHTELFVYSIFRLTFIWQFCLRWFTLLRLQWPHQMETVISNGPRVHHISNGNSLSFPLSISINLKYLRCEISSSNHFRFQLSPYLLWNSNPKKK